MVKIYLDRDQCEDFNVEYFESDAVSIPADVILHSKRNGYDKKHTEILESFGTKVINLKRSAKNDRKKDWDSPGWYRIISPSIACP